MEPAMKRRMGTKISTKNVKNTNAMIGKKMLSGFMKAISPAGPNQTACPPLASRPMLSAAQDAPSKVIESWLVRADVCQADRSSSVLGEKSCVVPAIAGGLVE